MLRVCDLGAQTGLYSVPLDGQRRTSVTAATWLAAMTEQRPGARQRCSQRPCAMRVPLLLLPQGSCAVSYNSTRASNRQQVCFNSCRQGPPPQLPRVRTQGVRTRSAAHRPLVSRRQLAAAAAPRTRSLAAAAQAAVAARAAAGGKNPHRPGGRSGPGTAADNAPISMGSCTRLRKGSFMSARADQGAHQGPPPTCSVCSVCSALRDDVLRYL